VNYELQMARIFQQWLKKLDKQPGSGCWSGWIAFLAQPWVDCKTVANNLFELRCFFGGGICSYFTLCQLQIVLLLVGGNKGSQEKDIEKAKEPLKNVSEAVNLRRKSAKKRNLYVINEHF